MKSLLESKTFWIAVIQAVVGGLVIFFTEVPDLVGYVAIVKSIGDILLRMVTTEAIR
jgi:hypothetical protein